MEERLVALETKVALGEDQIDALNRTVFRQQQQIELLQEQIRTLYRQMQAQATASGAEPRDLREDIPPHY
ncbi:SlyX family protein [Uliginosibacterium gangwonense]|uniref:SlyX family protein n=1 Tax=Uliginosibacterium gangwonense TaxID=392736 RepID=UPI00036C8FE5|nr:SlyX family protein [Uliginosibacterium gangwonense]